MPEQRNHFTNPPQRRLGGLGLVRNKAGEVLLVEKMRRAGQERPWGLPGGCVEENESVVGALVRRTREKLALPVVPGRLLTVHHVFAEQHEDHLSLEGVNYVFDCGVVDGDGDMVADGVAVSGWAWVGAGELHERAKPYTVQRALAALRALESGQVEYLEGHPA